MVRKFILSLLVLLLSTSTSFAAGTTYTLPAEDDIVISEAEYRLETVNVDSLGSRSGSPFAIESKFIADLGATLVTSGAPAFKFFESTPTTGSNDKYLVHIENSPLTSTETSPIGIFNGSSVSTVDSLKVFDTNISYTVPVLTIARSGALEITLGDNEVGLLINASASQTANLLMLQDSADNNVFQVKYDGSIVSAITNTSTGSGLSGFDGQVNLNPSANSTAINKAANLSLAVQNGNTRDFTSSTGQTAAEIEFIHGGTGTVTQALGGHSSVIKENDGPITTAIAHRFTVGNYDTTGAITTGVAIEIDPFDTFGAITNKFGIRQSGSENNALGGALRVGGTTAPTSGIELDVTGDGAFSGELSVGGVSGTGKVWCVKSDGNAGVCSDAPGGSGTCTCG